MPHVEYRARVDRPPEQVFDFVADAENNPSWHAHVNETRWIDEGPTRVGRRGRQTGHLWGRDWVFVAEVATWDPPHQVAFQVIAGYKVRTTIHVEPDGEGSAMTLIVDTPPHLGPLDPVVSRLIKRMTGSRGRGDIERLKAALER